jgi:putative endonuclease
MKLNPNLPSKLPSKRSVGLQYETQAKIYLESQGLEYLESNFFCRVGEIDLVMRDGRELVFVEVRMRVGGFESAIESVSYGKLLKLRRAIEFYLLKRQALVQRLQPGSIRLDILGFDGDAWTWVKNQGI